MWHEGTPRCGTYSEIQPAPPGAPGSIPNIELADLAGVLQDAEQEAAAAAAAAAGASLGLKASAAGSAAAGQVRPLSWERCTPGLQQQGAGG